MEMVGQATKHIEESLEVFREKNKKLKEVILSNPQERSQQNLVIQQLKAQIRDLMRSEETTRKRLDVAEKQSNFMRKNTRGPGDSPFHSMKSGGSGGGGFEATVKGLSLASSGSMEDLSEVWMVFNDVKEMMLKIKQDVEEGVTKKEIELTESLLEKENDIMKQLNESEDRIRELRSQFRIELKEAKMKFSKELSDLSSESEMLKEKNDMLTKKCADLETQLKISQLSDERVKALAENIDALKKNQKTQDDLVKMERAVIEGLASQVEDKENKRAEVQFKYDSVSKKAEEVSRSRNRILAVFQQILVKHVKKKSNEKELQDSIEELTKEELENITIICEEAKIKLPLKKN